MIKDGERIGVNNKKDIKKILNTIYDTKSVYKGARYWQNYLLNLVNRVVGFKGLPKTCDNSVINLYKMVNGYTIFVKAADGGIYTPPEASISDYRSVYHIGFKGQYVSPVIGSGFNLVDGKDCVIAWNTDYDMISGEGSILWDKIRRTARLLADIESTVSSELICNRTGMVAEVLNKTAADTYNAMLTNLEQGKVDSVINKTLQFETIKPMLFNHNAISLAEYTQIRDYIINDFMNSFGIQSKNEEKKAQMVSDEIYASQPQLDNAIDALYQANCRTADKYNAVFGAEYGYIEPFKAIYTEPIQDEEEAIAEENDVLTEDKGEEDYAN